ncbi:hypothetical protein HGRIS_001744 [Hohenbuehelia grisea]|uniref:DUF2828 domain-containing protein n=1 Tax=Hohenbuehelia grisea TaxID=104357 RepID=A0ABR3JJ01_9AGAR
MVSTPAAVNSSQNFVLPTIPELFDPNFLDILLPPAEKAQCEATPGPTVASNPMMAALEQTAHQTFTQNMAPAYSSTLSASLDAFQGLSSAFGTTVDDLLNKSWAEDPNLTMRIIWNLRSIHDGKGDKESFYRAFGWLYEHHPRTAISNLHQLVAPVCKNPKSKWIPKSHGYWKDLLNILALATLDRLGPVYTTPTFLHAERQRYTYPNRNKVKTGDRDTRIEAGRLNTQKAQAEAKAARVEAAKHAHTRIEQKLAIPKYRALYIAVARLFADRLAQDLRLHEEIANLPPSADRRPLLHQISLAAKWAPTPQLSHDRQTNISTAIALILQNMQVAQFPTALTREDLPARSHAAILRSFYQRWVLRPLREISVIPEPLMAANKWTEIKYSRVSSLCMKLHQGHFSGHDPEGFEQYLLSVEEGKTKISGVTLMPHELVAQVVRLSRISNADPSRSKTPLLQSVADSLGDRATRRRGPAEDTR